MIALAAVTAVVAALIAVAFVATRTSRQTTAASAGSGSVVTVTATASAASPGSSSAPAGATTSTTTAPASTTTTDPAAAAGQSLAAARARSLNGLSKNGRWVLQLASKADGTTDPRQTTANGSHTFHLPDIVAQFDQLSTGATAAGMTPLVLLASDFGTTQSPGSNALWVLLADPGGLTDRAAAVSACQRLFPTLTGKDLDNSCLPRTLVPAS